jgi:hypothetical protein
VGSFDIAPGGTQAITLTLTRTTAAFNAWVFGTLVLTSDDGRTLRLPISVRPMWGTLTSPVAASTDQASGSVPLSMRTGWAGALSETAWGLAPPHVEAAGRRITATTRKPDPTGTDPGTQVYPLTVPAGSQLLSARISNADTGADLDLFLYRVPAAGGAPTLVASSQRNDANEQVNVAFPAAGQYLVAVLGFTTPGATGSAYDLRDWVVTDPSPDDLSDGGPGIALTADPLTVAAGDQPTQPLRWAGLGAKGLYLGLVSYSGPEAAPSGFSTVSVVELTKTDPVATPTPTPTPTPSATPTPVPTAEPAPKPPARKPPGVSVRSLRLTGRLLALRLANAAGAQVHVAIERGGRLVTMSGVRRAPASGALTLRLNRALKPGGYTVKVIAELAGRRTAARVSLRVSAARRQAARKSSG